MNMSFSLRLLEETKKEDEKFLADKRQATAATFCAQCHKNTHKNTFVGLKPFWHRFGRQLCDACGRDYVEMLKALGAWDDK